MTTGTGARTGRPGIRIGAIMKFWRKPFVLAAVMTSMAALAVAGGGVASAASGAEITNMGLAEIGHGACLTAQAAPGTAITQETCANTANQQWIYIGTPTDNNPIQIQNIGTGQCMGASAFGNAAPVVQVSCGAQGIGSYWNRNTLFGLNDPVQGYQFKANFANYCLDLENGLSTLGMSMQVWQCNPRTRNQDWDIFAPQ
jgi:ricin-type beta-trefoil lectin protein